MSARSVSSVSIKDLSLFQALQMIEDLKIETSYDIKRIDLPRARQILQNHLDKQSGRRRLSSAPQWDITSGALQEDKTNRQKLIELYSETEKYMEKLPKAFRDNLEEVFPGFGQTLKQHQKEMEETQVVFLVAGDEGSGKSSLVNLLLGKELLPTNSIRCTSAIVEIRHGAEPAAIIHWREDSAGRANKPFNLKLSSFGNEKAFIEELEKHIKLVDEDTDETPYDVIKLFWPLDALKNGVTIVDSPGIGGSKGLPEHLSTYMEKAFGFIYVIDSTSSIHKERLGQLLLRATEANDIFDDSTALFVCNKWDSFSQDESEEVLDNIQRRLAVIIPDVRRNQLYPISIREAAKNVECNEVTDLHQKLIEGIRCFLPQAMKGKLRTYYRYLSSLLQKSLYSLRFSNNMHQKEQEEIKAYYQNVCDRISLLQSQAETRLDELKKEVRIKTMDVCEKIMDHLNSMHVSVQLAQWHPNQCPKKEKSWQNIAKNANLYIAGRLALAVNSWEVERNIVVNFYQNVVKKFEQKLNLFGDSIQKVEGVFMNQEDIRRAIDCNHVMMQNAAPKKSAKPTTGTSYLSLGQAVGSAVVLDLKNNDVKKLFKEEYGDPSRAMEKATQLALNTMSGYHIDSALTKFFDRFMKGIDRVGQLVPDIMKADKKLLQELTAQLSTGEEKLGALPYLSKTCSEIHGNLNMFYLYRLMVPDFSQNQIKYGDVLGRGSFAIVYKAEAKTPAGTKTVAVKDPLDPIKTDTVTDMLLEESMLREMNNVNIVKYYGFSQTGKDDKFKIAMVMDFCPGTLKAKFVDKKVSPGNFERSSPKYRQSMDNVAYFLMQICNGLNYLHKKHVVHRDIKPENILLTTDNIVKIADLGLAKKDHEIINSIIGTPIYMAPEVMFASNKYDTKADIYSLGLIMWELWYGKDLASYAANNLVGGLRLNIKEEWRPKITDQTTPDDFWKSLLEKSWHQDPKNRPTAAEIGNSLLSLRRNLSSK